jgi:hypothetical protein
MARRPPKTRPEHEYDLRVCLGLWGVPFATQRLKALQTVRLTPTRKALIAICTEYIEANHDQIPDTIGD